MGVGVTNGSDVGAGVFVGVGFVAVEVFPRTFLVGAGGCVGTPIVGSGVIESVGVGVGSILPEGENTRFFIRKPPPSKERIKIIIRAIVSLDGNTP